LNRTVIDASAVLGAFMPDEFVPEARALFANSENIEFHVPQIWHVETGNALLMANRRGRIDASMLASLLQDLSGMEFVQDERTSQYAWSQTLTLALKHRLTLYDASYLELALRLDANLATLDARLSAAAKSEDVELAL
jgi:predicted nucleic acid-binding protein